MSGHHKYGLGKYAREARMIARQIADELGDAPLDGPEARDLILAAAAVCPLVRSPQQATAVVDGWEGVWHELLAGISVRLRVCYSAGRQLAVLKGVFT